MVLVGAAILPHGAIFLDGDPSLPTSAFSDEDFSVPPDLMRKFSDLYNSCERAGDLVAKMSPDIVVLFTPHGLTLTSTAFGVYIASAAKGQIMWKSYLRELDITLDPELSFQFLEFVQKRECKADGIVTFTGSDAPLMWGEVIPLWFVEKNVDSGKIKYIITSFTDGEPAEDMGRALHEFISTLEERVAVVISGDLSHRHKSDCDIPRYMPGMCIRR